MRGKRSKNAWGNSLSGLLGTYFSVWEAAKARSEPGFPALRFEPRIDRVVVLIPLNSRIVTHTYPCELSRGCGPIQRRGPARRMVLSLAVGLAFLALVSATDTAAQASAAPLIQIGSPDSLYSSILKEQRHFWIHLPPGFVQSDGREYPVIYLLDGEALLGGLAAIQEFYNQFRLPEMIVVAISNADNRTRDLTPTEVAHRHGMAVPVSGGADRFLQFLEEELIPHIESAFPTAPHRVLIGHSYGGLFAIHTLANRPGLFNNFVAIDPSLDWDGGHWLSDTLAKIRDLAAPPRGVRPTGLHVSVANEIIRFSHQLTVDDVASDTTEFSLGIRSLLTFARTLDAFPPVGLRFEWEFYPKDIHGSVPLAGMRDGLIFLYDAWELKRPSMYNDPSTPAAELLALIQAQSAARTEMMWYHSPMEEELLDMLGNMALQMGQPEKAIAVLGLNARYYPESLAAHLSLVEACLETDDFQCAREHARIADRISGGSEHVNRIEAQAKTPN